MAREKTSQDIQREGLGTQLHEVTLKQLFDFDDVGSPPKGSAYAWVSYMGKDGQRYGSFKCIREECIEGREYTLSQSSLIPWSIHILFTDEIFDPKSRDKIRSLNVLTRAKN